MPVRFSIASSIIISSSSKLLVRSIDNPHITKNKMKSINSIQTGKTSNRHLARMKITKAGIIDAIIGLM